MSLLSENPEGVRNVHFPAEHEKIVSGWPQLELRPPLLSGLTILISVSTLTFWTGRCHAIKVNLDQSCMFALSSRTCEDCFRVTTVGVAPPPFSQGWPFWFQYLTQHSGSSAAFSSKWTWTNAMHHEPLLTGMKLCPVVHMWKQISQHPNCPGASLDEAVDPIVSVSSLWCPVHASHWFKSCIPGSYYVCIQVLWQRERANLLLLWQ